MQLLEVSFTKDGSGYFLKAAEGEGCISTAVYVRLASHSLFSDWTGAGEKGLVTLGYSLCKSGMLLNINVTCKLSNLF